MLVPCLDFGCFRWFLLLPSMGSVASAAGSSTPSPLCGVHLSGGNRVFVDACIWDEFSVTAAVLERSTLASPPLFWFHAFLRRALAFAAVGASPPYGVINLYFALVHCSSMEEDAIFKNVISRIFFSNVSHQAPAVFRFSACVSNATTTGGLYGPHMTRIWSWPAPNIVSCWDRAPRDPRGVPWDRIFLLKNFLISSSNDLILWVLWIGYAKNAKNQEKLVIFSTFPYY